MIEFAMHRALLGVVLALSIAGAARAQETPIWADIECSQSQIVAPAGLKCRATQIYSGSASQIPGAGGKGQRRQWASFGSVGGDKIYAHCLEEISNDAYAVAGPLDQSIRNLSPYAKRARDFSDQQTLNDGSYSTFASEAGEKCVAVRKFGPSRSKGYKWILQAHECLPVGKSLSQGDIGQFIAQVNFHD